MAECSRHPGNVLPGCFFCATGTEPSGSVARRRVEAAGYRPGVAQVRLVGPPDVIDAALRLLADVFGDAWQSSTRKTGRLPGGDQLLYGTLIVPVPRGEGQ